MTPNDDVDVGIHTSPTSILYGAVERYLILRVGGRGAEQALQGLLSIVHPILDRQFAEDMIRIRGDSCNEWDMFQAIVGLLRRKNLWLVAPRALMKGEELLGAIE